MKIKLIGATFYMNDPIFLNPVQKEVDIAIDTLDSKVLRILAAGVANGLVAIADEDNAEFLAAVDKLKEKVKVKEDKQEAVKEVAVKEKPVEVEVKEDPVAEEEKPATVKKTATKATTTKKATAK